MASKSTDGQPFVMCWESISCDVGGYAAIIEWFLQMSTTHSSVYLTGNAYDKMVITATQMAKYDLFKDARVRLPKDAPTEFRVPIATKLVQLKVHSAAKLAERAFAMLIEICNVLEALEWSDAIDREYLQYKSILKNRVYPVVITYARVLVKDMVYTRCPIEGTTRITYDKDLAAKSRFRGAVV